MGHEPVLADSEEIEARAFALSRECGLIIDHSDTFRGRGLFRGFVRKLLESAGGNIVGSSAEACFLADNKIAAKRRLSARGLPVPPGAAIFRPGEKIPKWLRPPLILKPAFEHMSRGVRTARTFAEAESGADEILAKLRQPVLVEKYIPGRELAVSVLEEAGGLRVLPILEWVVPGKRGGILSEAFKLTPPSPNRKDALPAELPAEKAAEIGGLSAAAFRALGLRDYARFDLRLSPGGHPFILEANITPSLEFQEALALSAKWAGLDYAGLLAAMIAAARNRLAGKNLSQKTEISIDLPAGPVALTVPAGLTVPAQSSVDLAGLLDIQAGERVLDLGCGSGLLSIAAAKAGASFVLATDLDPHCLETTLANARRNGIRDGLALSAGFWFEAVPREERKKGFAAIIATPPQTPGPRPFGPKYGGEDGTRHLLHIADEAPLYLHAGSGRLFLLAVSLANPGRVLKRLQERFREVRVIKETERFFTREEYEGYEEGLFAHLRRLKTSNRSEFRESGPGRYVFRNLCICARGPRKP